MALFSEGETSPKEVETIIGQSVKVDGNFKSDGNITVNGVVQGSLKTNHDLRIGPSAKIKAEVYAQNLFLEGEIRGNVTVKEKATLMSTAKIFGNLETKILSVEENAIINGKCVMIPEQNSEEQKPEAKKPSK